MPTPLPRVSYRPMTRADFGWKDMPTWVLGFLAGKRVASIASIAAGALVRSPGVVAGKSIA